MSLEDRGQRETGARNLEKENRRRTRPGDLKAQGDQDPGEALQKPTRPSSIGRGSSFGNSTVRPSRRVWLPGYSWYCGTVVRYSKYRRLLVKRPSWFVAGTGEDPSVNSNGLYSVLVRWSVVTVTLQAVME